jgi:hypothetical protein
MEPSNQPEAEQDWVVWFINEFADETRRLSNETGGPYPGLGDHPETPAAFLRCGEPALVNAANKAFAVVAAGPDPTGIADALGALFMGKHDVSPTVIDGDIVLVFGTSDAPDLEAEVGRRLVATLADPAVHGLGLCDEHHCVDVFIDRSRRHNRRFCTTTCQVRARVARHRSRATT